MKKLFIIALLCLGLQSFAQIGNLYIYNLSSLPIQYELLAYENNSESCYPTFGFGNPPSSAGFTLAAGQTHVFNGFNYPTTPNFPTPPTGGWKWRKVVDSTNTAVMIPPAVAQVNAGTVNSAIQARWNYFKLTVTPTVYAGIGFTSTCRFIDGTTYTNGTFVASIVVSGTDTIVTLTN